MKIKEKNKDKKGISLIVLIITIAVIIILASAVILSIANNRPIDSAKEATKMHNESVLKESAAVLSAQWKTDSLLGNTTMSRNEYVMQGLSTQGFTEEERDRVTVDEETGNILIDVINAKVISKAPDIYYGATVSNYTAENSNVVGWKILYSDEKNVYLIADDYIPFSSIPNSTNSGQTTSNKINQGQTAYSGYFADVIKDYLGSDSIVDVRLKNLNSKYYDYLNLNAKSKSTNNNMKAVAYMMDIVAWNKFAGKDAEYAIGGPTIELIVNSYNQKNKNNKLDLQVKDGIFSSGGSESSGLGINGYTFKKTNSSTWTVSLESVFDTSDGLYVISTSNKASTLWLSSPNASSSDTLIGITSRGRLDSIFYNDDRYSYGFRPVICLKENVQFVKQDEKNYLIK